MAGSNGTNGSNGAAKRRVTFTVTAPEAKEVYLCGTFNDWGETCTPMKPDGKGRWKAIVNVPPGAHEYRLRVDGEWADDPDATLRVPNDFGTHNCVKEVTAKV